MAHLQSSGSSQKKLPALASTKTGAREERETKPRVRFCLAGLSCAARLSGLSPLSAWRFRVDPVQTSGLLFDESVPKPTQLHFRSCHVVRWLLIQPPHVAGRTSPVLGLGQAPSVYAQTRRERRRPPRVTIGSARAKAHDQPNTRHHHHHQHHNITDRNHRNHLSAAQPHNPHPLPICCFASFTSGFAPLARPRLSPDRK